MKLQYLIFILFGFTISLGGFLIEPLLPLYLIFYRDIRVFYEVHLLSLVFYLSSFMGKLTLTMVANSTGFLVILSAIVLPVSILSYSVLSGFSIMIVRVLHGFTLSVLVTSIWMHVVRTTNPTLLRRVIGLLNAFIGLAGALTFILSYRLIQYYGFNILFLIAVLLCILSLPLALIMTSSSSLLGNGFRVYSSLIHHPNINIRTTIVIFVVLLCILVRSLGYGIVKPYFPQYIVLLFDNIMLAWSIFVYAGLSYISGSLLSIIALRFIEPLKLMTTSLLGISIGTLIYTYTTSPEEFMVATITTSLSSSIYKVSYINYLSRAVHGSLKVLLIVIALSLSDIGYAIGSLISPSVGDIRLSFTVNSILTLTCIPLIILLMVKHGRIVS